MVITKIQGGLGNQMFQFAIGLAQSPTVYLDLEFIKQNNKCSVNFTKRYFELDVFPNLKYKTLTKVKKKIFFSEHPLFKAFRRLIHPHILVQNENELINIPRSKWLYFDGYFQSEKYFFNKRKELLKQFTFPPLDHKNQLLKEKIQFINNSVAIHIRRGDYLKPEVQNYHGVLPLSYYEEAIALLLKDLGEITLIIFSDDIEFAKLHLSKYKNTIIVTGNNDAGWKDMALMSSCTHHIIANSTFSWWGAWLSISENGKKIAPKDWFNKQVVNYNINNIIPSSWIKI